MSNYLLLLLIIIPFCGALFVMISKNDKVYASSNAYNVLVWSLLANLALVLIIGSKMNVDTTLIKTIEQYKWLSFPLVNIRLSIDTISLILILSINLSFFIAGLCVKRITEHSKTLIAGTLLFISLLDGYFIADDLLSFYAFFAALSAPVIILMSLYSRERKKNTLIKFSLYNLIGAILLFVAIMLIYNDRGRNVWLNAVGELNLKKAYRHFIWISIFFAFISKLPIWPFHYWLSSINSGLKHPISSIIGSQITLVGLYGFIRFWPNTMPDTIQIYSSFFEIICIITMLFISLVSLSYKEIRYKLFAYTTVYYLLFMLGVFLPTDKLLLNISYSLFSMLIIISVLYLLVSRIDEERKNLNLLGLNGILCYMPRASQCVSLFVLAGMGLPITPLFWNNFIIISEIFNNNLILGILVMLSVFLVAISLLEELYKLKDKSYATTICSTKTDLTNTEYVVYIICLIVLFLSFLDPLWFII